MAEKMVSYQARNGVPGLTKIKNIIAVASGKGGVGKSTVAVNLALAMQQQGLQIGLLDADIYGPSQPKLLGQTQKPIVHDDKTVDPVWAHGIQTMSIGYLISAASPAVWRGPMVSGALLQMLNDTRWQSLDCLIIDLPPGTGDIQLTLAQKIPVVGAVVVTTPQDVALIDVAKSVAMFQKVKVPVLGMVENMSTYRCPNCDHEAAIFGERGGQALAMAYDIPLLAKLPLDIKIRQQCDNGLPIVIAEPDNIHSQTFKQLSSDVLRVLGQQQRDYRIPSGKIKIETT